MVVNEACFSLDVESPHSPSPQTSHHMRRHMLELLDSDCNAPSILQGIHTQHASFAVPMLARLLLEARDPGVGECLLQLATRLALAADYLPEMFMNRLDDIRFLFFFRGKGELWRPLSSML